MARIYESANINKKILIDGGTLEFNAVFDETTERWFGQLDIENQVWLDMLKKPVFAKDEPTKIISYTAGTPEQLAKIIEGSSDFKNHVAGKKGTWPQEERLEALKKSLKVSHDKPGSAFGLLTSDELRAVIERRGGKVNPEARHDELVKVAAKLASAGTGK